MRNGPRDIRDAASKTTKSKQNKVTPRGKLNFGDRNWRRGGGGRVEMMRLRTELLPLLRNSLVTLSNYTLSCGEGGSLLRCVRPTHARLADVRGSSSTFAYTSFVMKSHDGEPVLFRPASEQRPPLVVGADGGAEMCVFSEYHSRINDIARISSCRRNSSNSLKFHFFFR